MIGIKLRKIYKEHYMHTFDFSVNIRHYIKKDKRDLFLFGNKEHTLEPTNDMPPLNIKPQSHKRWNPFHNEWVVYTPSRQDRTFNPPKEYCPLCVVKKDGYQGEIPFEEFEVAVFENRFASLHPDSARNLPDDFPYAPITGRCEVVVYSSEHNGNFGLMPVEKCEVLIQAWIHRYLALLDTKEIQFVMPFENRGEAIGVTLPHPHGQIYAFDYIPTDVQNMAKAFRTAPFLDIVLQHKELIVDESEYFYQVVPYFARFPFESWIIPKKRIAGLWEIQPNQISDYAAFLLKVVRRYDAIFNEPMPYIMLQYSSPKGEEKTFGYHVQFLPFKRSANKLKFLAGCEQGAGVFLADILPEDVAAQLRAVSV